jgi:hypothetical protein
MKDKSYLTAIARRTIPSPVRWLMRQGYVSDHPMIATLDFGCGKCASVNPKSWTNYDPHYAPDAIQNGQKFMVILCIYVLCVLPKKERRSVIKKIRYLLSDWGCAYIAVRNDRPRWGWGRSSRGTYQGRVRKLNLPLVHQTSQFRIYQLTKTTKLPY